MVHGVMKREDVTRDVKRGTSNIEHPTSNTEGVGIPKARSEISPHLSRTTTRTDGRNIEHSTSNAERRSGDRRRGADSTVGINVAAWAGVRQSGELKAESGAEVRPPGLKPQINADQRRSEARRKQLEAGERKFVEALMKFTQGAKRSQEPAVAVAARRWEGKIHFHVRVAIKQRERRRDA